LRRQFLNERRDRRPEHVKAGRDEHDHAVHHPGLFPSTQCEDRNRKDDDSSQTIKKHDDDATVFAINNDARERQHEKCGNRQHHRHRAESRLAVCFLQNVPSHTSSIHTAANHGDQIGNKDQPQPAMLKNILHD
jgi:hypothetical protein